MSDPFSDGDIAKTIGHPLMVALGAALALLTAGPALFSIAGGIRFLAFSLMYRRLLGILGA